MSLFLLQGIDVVEIAGKMGGVAWGVVIILFIMSIWSIAVMIERFFTFRSAKKQSREFAPAVAEALKDGKIEGRAPVGHPVALQVGSFGEDDPS